MKYARWFSQLFVAALVMGPSCGVAAQDAAPADPYPDEPEARLAPPEPAGPEPNPEQGAEPGTAPAEAPEAPEADAPAPPDAGDEPVLRPAASEPARPRRPKIAVTPPNLFAGPSGRMVPGAVVFSSSSIDTGGDVRSDLRVGLGDVAEFGIATDDRVRVRRRIGVTRDTDGSVEDFGSFSDSEAIQPYFSAVFKLGVAEGRLFSAQPAVAIEFRKSFEEEEANRDTRVASLTLTASKSFFDGNLTAHLGVGLWDAEVEREVIERDAEAPPRSAGRQTLSLHDEGAGDQVRPYGGLEFRALDHAVIVVDLFWAPEFTFGDLADSDLDRINLRPLLAWGTRYEVGPSAWLEAGVRVPDIGDANLLNAQIFGQVSFTYRGLRDLLVRD